MKRYKLLKNLPGIEKGTIFKQQEEGSLYSFHNEGAFHVHRRYVENNPSWFKELKEETLNEKIEKMIQKLERWVNSFPLGDKVKFSISDREMRELIKPFKQLINSEVRKSLKRVKKELRAKDRYICFDKLTIEAIRGIISQELKRYAKEKE